MRHTWGAGARRVLARSAIAMIVVVTVITTYSPPAWAHGIGGHAISVPDFLWSGVLHMLTGWDHLLFVAGVVLLSGAVWRSAKLISMFAVGHSSTLIAAAVAGWQVNPVVVDVVIALSLVFVGLLGPIARPGRWPDGSTRWLWFAVGVFCFGLVHGLGLATRLQDLGLPEEGLLLRVLAFNVGVEMGQLLGVLVMFVVLRFVKDVLSQPAPQRVVQAGMVAAGLVAAAFLAGQASASGTSSEEQQASSSPYGNCQIVERTRKYPFGGGHPAKSFFEPAEATPLDDFGHVLADGYLVVHYSSSIESDDVKALRDFVTGPDGTGIVAGADDKQSEPIQAMDPTNALRCDTFDLDGLRAFATR
ncbi:HupE/UreJ family protein [Actinopolymorpha sp. B17G11]|uniref:HupE/UreJ family protein n=1 Tax=Actinopolymorpha sp. B17G11 TaxID=3160861 RepID=UPI0032E4F798